MGIETDLNIPPYFADYDEEKDYYRMIFRPAMAVQARELTDAQTILQKQIERFGNHVFKDGSIVTGCAITYHPRVHYISVADTFVTNTDAFVTDFDNTYLITNSTNSNNAVRAVIKIAKTGIAESYPETNRLYLDYIATGKDGANDVYEFAPGDTLYFYSDVQGKFANLDANNLVDTIPTLASNGSFTSNGYAYCVSVTDGQIFQKGTFLRVEPQTIAVRDFSTNVTGYVVGFNTVESIVDENVDTSLYDNALGYSNENAPGAHRLKLVPTLVSKTRSDSSNNTNFFSIIEFDGNQPTQQQDDPAYAALQKSMAGRTYDESGDYIIKPFQIETRVNEANSQTFYYEVSPGIAYIRGYKVEKIGPTKIEVPRATTTDVTQNMIVTGNFGNYVEIVDVAGAFDTENMGEVSLFDANQFNVSQYEGTGAANTGSEVGKANIRAIIYNDGTKGTSDATYLAYLFNIRMNSGKSFSADVKSIVANSALGIARADLVLESNAAVLKDSTKTSLLFDTGLQAVKRLTNNTGIGDTSYDFIQTKTATLAVDGTIAVTIDTAGPGTSTERLTSAAGTLTGLSAAGYNIYLGANAYSANISGTVNLSSGNVALTGSGTAFATDFAANSLIQISANSTQSYVRRVVTVANNTYLTLDAPIAQSNASAVAQKYFVKGQVLPLSSVVINSNTAFTANAGIAIDSGTQTVTVSYPVNRNQATAIPKVIRKSRFVKIDCSNNAGSTTGPWDLGFTDVHKVRHVYVGTSYADTNPDRLDWFQVDIGQRDELYDHGRLVVKPQHASKITGSTKMLVELDFFTANTSASVGFFSVESYPIDDANTANTNAIQTIELPIYDGKELRNFIDFRPRKYNTANTSATTAGDATVNPSVSNTSFEVATGGQYLIEPDSNFIADAEFYLPRYDLITIDTTGQFNVNQGLPGVRPRPPFVENDQSEIAECYVPAYPSATKREYDTYKSTPSSKMKMKTIKRYTMKDIGVLDERIKRVEYYTVLNTLEQQARDMTIPDANGLDRFKNGIFADPFNSHNIGNVSDFEYKIAIDSLETVARPYFQKHDVDFTFLSANSTNATQIGPVVMLPYTHENYITQRFATKYRVATESVWAWRGILDLYPSYDFFRDEDTDPNINVNLDLATPWEDFVNSPFGALYGDWRDVSTQSTTVTTSNSAATTSTTSTTVTRDRIIDTLGVNVTTDIYNLGTYVKDVTIQPYMRSRLVAFVSRNMKPNTRLYAFFDDVNVSDHCAPGELSNISEVEAGKEDMIVKRVAAWGTPLVSDANGNVYGVFRIPAETFRTGDRVFQLLNVDDLVLGSSSILTRGKATYTADNVSVTKQGATLTVRQPTLVKSSVVETSTVSSNTSVVTIIPIIPPTIPPGPSSESDAGGAGGDADPIAQSFSISNVPADVSAVFISKIGVYFKAKDNSLGCSLYVAEMKNGMPDLSRVIGKAYLPSASINTSDTAASETQFILEYPVCCTAGQDYAFVIQPDGNSPEYQIWVGETGEFDVVTGEQVFSNPYSGIMFISANKKSWTPIQKEDIKFNIYRSRFTANTGNAVFKNENDEYLTVSGFNRANTSLGIQVGDLVFTVNSSANTANTANLVNHTLTSNTYPSGRVQWFNEADGEIWLDNSTIGGFSSVTNPTIAIYRIPDEANVAGVSNTTLIAYGTVTSVDNLTYHAVVPKFGVLQPVKTKLSYGFKGTKQSDNSIDGAFNKVVNEYELEFPDHERHVMSKSNEVASLSGVKSAEFLIDMETASDFVSPVINLSRKSSLFIENLINNDTTNEHTRYGNALSKYVSPKVVLKDGMEAEDIEVYMTAHRPSETDVKIFVKFKNPEDPELFHDKVWTELEYADGGEFVYSNPTNVKDYIEYKFKMPTSNTVAMGAFANSSTDIYTPLTGAITIENNKNEIVGVGTAFDTELTVGQTVRVVSNSYVAIRTIEHIANSTYLTVDGGLQASNSAALFYVYNEGGNGGRIEYKNSAGSRFVGYKEFAVKIVLTSSNPVKVPRLNDVRALALMV